MLDPDAQSDAAYAEGGLSDGMAYPLMPLSGRMEMTWPKERGSL